MFTLVYATPRPSAVNGAVIWERRQHYLNATSDGAAHQAAQQFLDTPVSINGAHFWKHGMHLIHQTCARPVHRNIDISRH